MANDVLGLITTNVIYAPQFQIITAIALLIVFHRYCQGGVCNIIKDMKGKIIIVTGANTGIGYDTALQLAKMNGTIILACRDKSRGETAVNKIREISSNKNVSFLQLDLSDLQSIETFADTFQKLYSKLDILINNAGVMLPLSRMETKNGFELQVGTNHLGHFHLTNLLLGILKSTPQSRIVNVASLAHQQRGQIVWENYNSQKSFDSSQSYSTSKLSNIYHAMVLQEQFVAEKAQIKAVSLHPGVVRTELTRFLTGNIFIQIFFYAIFPLWYLGTKSSLQGAQTTLFCALVDYENLTGGEYYSDCKIRSRQAYAQDMAKAHQLWELSEKMIQDGKKL